MLNKLPKIFSFSGRKHSGKTELAKVCIKYNYEFINFADSLKELICNALEISREYLEENKDLIIKGNFDLSKKIKYISNEINIEEKIVSEFLSEPFDSIREILQIVGTNLIRNYNELWHINKIKEKILNNPDKYYCIGDTRFINEKKMVEDLNGECWFIIRPNMCDISNHNSEINLKWNNFGNNIIINNVNKELLIQKWQNYLESLKYDELSNLVFNTSSKKELRNLLINLLKDCSPSEISMNLDCNEADIIWWCNNLMIQINREKYKYDNNTFLEATEESSYCYGLLTTTGYNSNLKLNTTNKYIVEMLKKTLKSNRPIEKKFINRKQIYSFECDNPFIIENLKLWNLNPIPFLINGPFNIELLKYWIIGLIDGNGSIVLYQNTLRITILASKQIIEYLYNILPYGKMNQYNYEKLYELVFLNNNCIELYKWLGDTVNIGLKCKWDLLKTN